VRQRYPAPVPAVRPIVRLRLLMRALGAGWIRVYALRVQILRDVRYGARVLWQSPGFTLAAAISLGLGIGLTVSMLTQIQSLALADVPGVREPEGLVTLQAPVSYVEFEEQRDTSGQFEALAAYMGPVPFVLAQPDGTRQRVWGQLITENYFSVLGVDAQAGRLPAPGDASWDGTIVISHRLWQSAFGGDRAVIGRAARLNGQPVTIGGMTPDRFLGAAPMTGAVDLWMPVTATSAVAPELGGNALRNYFRQEFRAIGRLRGGRDVVQAEMALDTIAKRLEHVHQHPDRDRPARRVTLLPGGRLMPIRNQDLARALGFPLLLVGLVLFMACVNVATMRLARGAARQREMAVRLALGASRARLVWQLLAESLLVAALGGLLGTLFVLWRDASTRSISRTLLPSYIYLDLRFDWYGGLMVVIITVGTGILFGLAPALQVTRAAVWSTLQSVRVSNRGVYRWLNLRNVLVLLQVTASLMVLLLSGFVLMGMGRATAVDLGFDARHLYVMSLDPVRDGVSTERTQALFADLPDRLARLPGVMTACLTTSTPAALIGGQSLMTSKVEWLGGPNEGRRLRGSVVGAGFFETLGIPVLHGRSFRRGDMRTDAGIVIVNESMARTEWPGREAVGQVLNTGNARYDVIGVVGNIRPVFAFDPAASQIYFPATPADYAMPSASGVTLYVRAMPGADGVAVVRRELAGIDATLTVFDTGSMTEQVNRMLYLMRIVTVVYGGVGVFGLLLASVGLGGVTAHAVARRTHEIGIRVALGASPSRVLRLVLAEGVAIIGVATVVGMLAAFAALQALRSFVEALAAVTKTSASDPLLIVGAPAVLAALTLLACYLPARRALGVNPVDALRSE
jgi:macrolide transport system ATP-binding/permease protein